MANAYEVAAVPAEVTNSFNASVFYGLDSRIVGGKADAAGTMQHAEDHVEDNFGRDVADKARKNFEIKVLNAAPESMSVVAGEKLKDIGTKMATAWTGRQTENKEIRDLRYQKEVWERVEKGTNILNAYAQVADEWGTGDQTVGSHLDRDSSKIAFYDSMRKSPPLIEAVAKADEQVARNHGYDSAADRQLWHHAGVSDQEKQGLDVWAKTVGGKSGQYKSFNDYMEKNGVATFNEQFSNGKTALQQVAAYYGQKDIHGAMPKLMAAVDNASKPHIGPHSDRDAGPVLAKLLHEDLTGIQTAANIKNADGTWNDQTQQKVQALIALGQSDTAYKGNHELIYGEKTHAALASLDTQGKLTQEQKNLFHAIEKLNGGDARQTARQLQATGYQTLDHKGVELAIAQAHTHQNIALGQEQIKAQQAALGPAPESPRDIPGMRPSSDPSAALAAFSNMNGNRPNYQAVQASSRPQALTGNLAVMAMNGQQLPQGAKVSTQRVNGQTVEVVKTGDKHHQEEFRAMNGKDGTFAEEIRPNGDRVSMVTVASNGQTTHDFERDGSNQLADLVKPSVPGTAPEVPSRGGQPSNTVLASAGQATVPGVVNTSNASGIPVTQFVKDTGPQTPGVVSGTVTVTNRDGSSVQAHVRDELHKNGQGGSDGTETVSIKGNEVQMHIHTEANPSNNTWSEKRTFADGRPTVTIDGKGQFPAQVGTGPGPHIQPVGYSPPVPQQQAPSGGSPPAHANVPPAAFLPGGVGQVTLSGNGDVIGVTDRVAVPAAKGGTAYVTMSKPYDTQTGAFDSDHTNWSVLVKDPAGHVTSNTRSTGDGKSAPPVDKKVVDGINADMAKAVTARRTAVAPQ